VIKGIVIGFILGIAVSSPELSRTCGSASEWTRKVLSVAEAPTRAKPLERIGGAHLQTVGWISRQKSSRPPVEGELFFLTSLFIEHPFL
jgi:hypothetical protein